MPWVNAIDLRLPVHRQALDDTQMFNARQLVSYMQGCRQHVIGGLKPFRSEGLKVQVHQAVIELIRWLPPTGRQPRERHLGPLWPRKRHCGPWSRQDDRVLQMGNVTNSYSNTGVANCTV
jgi:hypothetical protein